MPTLATTLSTLEATKLKNTYLHKRSSVPGSIPAPAKLAVGEIALNTADAIAYVKNAEGAVIPLGGRNSTTRSLVQYQGASLASQASQEGSLDLGRCFVLLAVSTNFAARVRVYASQSYRGADADRPSNVAPSGDHGLLLELITTPTDLDWTLSPMVFAGILDEGEPNTYISVTNLSNIAQAPQISFTNMVLED